MARFSRKQRFYLLFILLLAFALRLHRLGADSLWYDETVSALLAAKPLAAMWAHTAGDIHPPLYYALLHFWTAAAGHGEFALAFFSLWFGMAALPLVAHLGLRLFGPRAGLVAACLLAINPFAVWYSQEVRMYTLGVFLLGLILLVTVDYLERPGGRPYRLAAYAVLAALSLWTLYYTAFALVALNLFVIIWLWRRARSRLWPWLLANVSALVLYLPWLPIALRQALDPPVPPWRSPLPLPRLLLKIAMEGSVALSLGQSVDAARWWPLGLLGFLLALLALRAPARVRPSLPRQLPSLLLWTTLLGPVLLILIISELFSPLYHVRYLNLYSLAFPLLVAVGGLYVAGREDARGTPPKSGYRLGMRLRLRDLGTLLALAFILTGSAVSLRNYYTNRYAYEAADDLRSAVRLIYDRLGPRDAILINAGYLYPALLYYWPDTIGWMGRLNAYPPEDGVAREGPVVVLTGHVDGDPNIGWGDPNSDFYAIGRAETAAALERIFADTNTVWLLRGYDTVNDPQGFIRTWLEEHGTLYLDQVFPGLTYVRVQAWRTTRSSRQVPPPISHPLQADFDRGIRLLGYDLAPEILRPGHPLRLTLYWQRTGPIDKAYKVFTQLLNEQWQVVAQDDAQPGRGSLPTDRWQPDEVVESSFVLHPPSDLPAGTYRLLTGFYDETSGARLPLASGEDAVTLTLLQR
ncbi:MAG: hypothetical protein D6775_01880 [Caldilineae bacterium]|nr:MAG: hypothetical protein D6775_01880 [Caldilineae bacterium]